MSLGAGCVWPVMFGEWMQMKRRVYRQEESGRKSELCNLAVKGAWREPGESWRVSVRRWSGKRPMWPFSPLQARLSLWALLLRRHWGGRFVSASTLLATGSVRTVASTVFLVHIGHFYCEPHVQLSAPVLMLCCVGRRLMAIELAVFNSW